MLANAKPAGRIVCGNDPRSATGRARMKQIAAENQAEIRELVAGLLESLGRRPTAADEVLAEALAASTVRARRLRERGRDDGKERRSVERMMREWGRPYAERSHD